MPVQHKKPSHLNDLKALTIDMVPKADVHGRTNAAGDRMSGAAGLNKIGAGLTKKAFTSHRSEGFNYRYGAEGRTRTGTACATTPSR